MRDKEKIKIWVKNNTYFLFGIPMFGGEPWFEGAYGKHRIDELINKYMSWT